MVPWLGQLFTVCFWFGAAFTVLTTFLGLGHHGHLSASRLGHGGHAGTISPFNLSSILAFLVVFGAVGLSLQGGLGSVLALILATLGGLLAGWLVFLFFTRLIARGQTFLTDTPIDGTLATVTQAIGNGHIGEVMYMRHGVRRSDGARSVNDRQLAKGEQVVIVGYANGIATVQSWQELLDSPEPPRLS